MSIHIDAEHFADLVVKANPSKSEDAEDIAKDALELYITSYRLAERYGQISSSCLDTTEILKKIKDTELEFNN
ncbi:hypothetical protein [Staphylococcus argensis]|uniref:Uncharacterized protein n=1 Tax=Staphylococcus argensis TaxID=1607738 RepID=A0A2K4FEX3_9STAP|nr:hypothetical protein [Staphylococcus argensis]MCY6990341.1 hypothetical protein [Staphylococcus argensis]POA09857.1 hypothetical protein CD039_03675 [Staphylococcus argensis]